MKKTTLFLAALLFIAMGNAALAATTATNSTINYSVNAAPPAAVLNSFKLIFGNAPVKEWKLRSDGSWRAHFTFRGRAWEATFSVNGTLIKSEPK